MLRTSKRQRGVEVAAKLQLHGRRLVDIPAFGTPVRLVWVKRTWVCTQGSCPLCSFTETDADLAPATLDVHDPSPVLGGGPAGSRARDRARAGPPARPGLGHPLVRDRADPGRRVGR